MLHMINKGRPRVGPGSETKTMPVIQVQAPAPMPKQKTAKDSSMPRLLADIGGTNARFALEIAPGELRAITVLACEHYPGIHDAITAFLQSPQVVELGLPAVHHASLAIANPVDGDMVKMTNHHWSFSIRALQAQLGWDTLVVVNDFTALAMALPSLGPQQRLKVGKGTPVMNRPIGLLGPGTGLGVSGIIRAGEHWVPLHSEGGHVSFSPADEREVFLLRYLWREFEHVSAERLVSGRGLEMIYLGLAERNGVQLAAPLAAAEISAQALDGSCVLCLEAVECFCAMLGTVAGNLAVTLGALGGIYIGGGIIPRLGDLFERSPFRARFEAKGRFVEYLSQIPTYLITAEHPAFYGASALLDERLSTPA